MSLNSPRASRLCWVLALLLPLPAALADDADDLLQFEVAPGITAHARLLEGGDIEVTTNRASSTQRLAPQEQEERRADWTHGDYNFDGYQDLIASTPLGQVNDANRLYLYVPATGSFQELVWPETREATCGGFWSLSPDPATRTLTSSCRSGPMWYSDIYRYDGARLYLYRSMRMAGIDAAQLAPFLRLDAPDEADLLVVWSTWNAAGERVEQALWNAMDPPPEDVPIRGAGAVVVPARLPLYRTVGDAATTRYLVKGDHVELMDIAEGRLQVRYRNPTRGPVSGWIQVFDSP